MEQLTFAPCLSHTFRGPVPFTIEWPASLRHGCLRIDLGRVLKL